MLFFQCVLGLFIGTEFDGYNGGVYYDKSLWKFINIVFNGYFVYFTDGVVNDTWVFCSDIVPKLPLFPFI